MGAEGARTSLMFLSLRPVDRATAVLFLLPFGQNFAEAVLVRRS